jgi:ectoine hydroxylase-related dioxygenase (phytanoyl-CoA dioxygenase family)
MSETDLLQHLKIYGWAVVPNVLSKNEVIEAKRGFLDWLKKFDLKFDVADPSTWTKKNLLPAPRGIIQQFGIGQAQFMWDLRSKPAIIDIFAKLWATSDLWVSFDGANLSVPFAQKEKSWPHVDQSPMREGFQCWQGAIALTDWSETKGTLIFYEKSHTDHSNIRLGDTYRKTSYDKNYYQFKDEVEAQKHLTNPVKKIAVQCSAGDFVLWDSRLIHWGKAPEKPKKGDIPNYRMAAYICMQPYTSLTPQVQTSLKKRKLEAIEKGETTNHWPLRVNVNGEVPNWSTNNMVNIRKWIVAAREERDSKKLKLNEVAKKLAGLD